MKTGVISGRAHIFFVSRPITHCISIHLLIYSAIHHAVHQSPHRWPFRSFLSGPMPFLCPGHTINPPPPLENSHHAHICTSMHLQQMDGQALSWQTVGGESHVGFRRRFVRSCSVCLRGSVHKGGSPQTELSACGLWGLSGRIIDDVFITSCGVMWGLGAPCVSVGMGRLTQLPPL